ncbi:hypothetical protein BCR33DRAFT_736264 [Rhizoclosmatium globosum]|uniref:Uncharacterized protein n=1 Tax=Rhizoclosmatium globosum TaxID=329046 RepID=A0A1Y2CKE9_9FUNG|nr:hypothetical protein BCR33DRAFT_736264 [Rhizoclosmatium globosum]|eukprot:ORY47466.1 hypothetical protein BCR33DRAFT_736264 [Rhizoclosmatium globosum]
MMNHLKQTDPHSRDNSNQSHTDFPMVYSTNISTLDLGFIHSAAALSWGGPFLHTVLKRVSIVSYLFTGWINPFKFFAFALSQYFFLVSAMKYSVLQWLGDNVSVVIRIIVSISSFALKTAGFCYYFYYTGVGILATCIVLMLVLETVVTDLRTWMDTRLGIMETWEIEEYNGEAVLEVEE